MNRCVHLQTYIGREFSRVTSDCPVSAFPGIKCFTLTPCPCQQKNINHNEFCIQTVSWIYPLIKSFGDQNEKTSDILTSWE